MLVPLMKLCYNASILAKYAKFRYTFREAYSSVATQEEMRFIMDKKAVKSGGNLKISNEVIEKIAELAATEITGVAVNGQHIAVNDTSKAVAGRFLSPIKVRLSSEAAEIDISIIVVQGCKAVSVAEAVQHSIKSAVQNMTGIAVSKVNVKISGILITNEDE